MSIAASLVAQGEDDEAYRREAFAALWLHQLDLGDPAVIKSCLMRGGLDPANADGQVEAGRQLLTEATVQAYKLGIFGVPTFVHGSDIYFGADRMEVLASRL